MSDCFEVANCDEQVSNLGSNMPFILTSHTLVLVNIRRRKKVNANTENLLAKLILPKSVEEKVIQYL